MKTVTDLFNHIAQIHDNHHRAVTAYLGHYSVVTDTPNCAENHWPCRAGLRDLKKVDGEIVGTPFICDKSTKPATVEEVLQEITTHARYLTSTNECHYCGVENCTECGSL